MKTGLQGPTYTQTPNEIFALMPEMSDCELRVVMAICRQTFGWHKEHDRLSLSQLMTFTGLSRQGVIDGIKQAMERGIVDREPIADSFNYFLVVNQVDYQLVNDVDTQKKEEKEKVINNKTEAKSPKQEAWEQLRDVLVVVSPMDLERFEACWSDFPDWRRHEYALEQMKKYANPVSSKYYETIFLRYDPQKPKEKGKANGRGEHLTPTAPPEYRHEDWLRLQKEGDETPEQTLDRLKLAGKVPVHAVVRYREKGELYA